MNIQEALRNLDPLNDDHWTSNGDPRIDAVKSFLGSSVTREEIVAAAPDFNREKAGTPESLIMNQSTVAEPTVEDDDEEPQVAINEGTAGVSEISAIDHLIENTDSEISDLLKKFRFDRRGLKPREVEKILKAMDVDEAKTFRAAIEAQLAEISKSMQEIQAYEKIVRSTFGIVKNHLLVADPPESDQQSIRRFLDAQQALRLKKADQRAAVLKTLNPNDLNPLSPLDQAMARKTARGTKRPVWPGLKV